MERRVRLGARIGGGVERLPSHAHKSFDDVGCRRSTRPAAEQRSARRAPANARRVLVATIVRRPLEDRVAYAGGSMFGGVPIATKLPQTLLFVDQTLAASVHFVVLLSGAPFFPRAFFQSGQPSCEHPVFSPSSAS
jgi:hypothetical protein